MRTLATLSGVLGIVISLFCQLFAIIDDSYTFGNIGFLGVISGVIAIVGANLMKRNKKYAASLLLVSCVTGIIAISYFYILPSLFTVFPLVTLIRSKENK
ncbi:hypothetical protein SAMN05216389_10642 [Oceanobacillus limi]|uniref:DUF4064 domain-containing protein n=1 Tax=Oceanobacillus limi TaxID=930131 RepID=A0A1I0C5V2_9BACI|nr:hypothetical protein [Oceanobacillus limi]SET14690.1 hypothetical protein SAMN05216389_10642 [Oceanobacillus limi]